MSTARFLVSGRVQGVAFRAHARDEACRLGLDGRACNLDDGRVDVTVAGDDAAIEAFTRWLAEGPPLARVDEVSRVEPVPGPVAPGFTIG
jgi:acylphosphatase